MLNDGFQLIASFLAGTAATAGVLSLIRWMPLPGCIKTILAVVVPVPAMAIALVLIHYGPPAARDPSGLAALPGAPRVWLRLFLYGCLATLGTGAAAALWRLAWPPEDRDDADEDAA